MWSESFFVYFWLLKVPTQKKLFLTTLPFYGPSKMANFATFRRRVSFLILSVFLAVFCTEQLYWVQRVVFVCFLYFEAQSQCRPLWPFSFAIAFAKWPFLAPYENFAIFGMWGVSPGRFLTQCDSNVVLAFCLCSS